MWLWKMESKTIQVAFNLDLSDSVAKVAKWS